MSKKNPPLVLNVPKDNKLVKSLVKPVSIPLYIRIK